MIYETIKKELKDAVVRLNVAADHESLAANREAFGEVKAFTKIIESMGHKVDGQFKSSDRGCLHLFTLDIDGVGIDQRTGNDLQLW